MNKIIEIKDISKIYKMKNKEVIALDHINLSFEKGKLYAIMGHSGSGKSTLISIMGLMEPYTSGKYIMNNEEINTLNDEELSYLRMKTFGFVFQDFYLDEYLKAYENVMMPMLINTKIQRKERKRKAIELLKIVGLEKRIDHFPRELSGGEQQRVAIARSLANDPDIILADEPTGNLDQENEEMIFKELKKLSQEGKCVVVVSHSDEIKKYADVVYNLERGKTVV